MWPMLALGVPLLAQQPPPGSAQGQPRFQQPKEVRFVPAAQADFMRNDDRVLGMSLNGVSKAYLTRVLAYHHIVHDQFMATPVVVTW